MNERIKMDTLLSLTLVYIMIGTSIHFLMPIHLVNPYEYFYGSELKEFQIYQIFFGGVLLSLSSLTVGYLVTKTEEVIKPLILSVLVLFLISLVFNGQDVLFLSALSGFIVLLLRKRSILITVITMGILVITHIFLNAIIPSLNALNTSNIVYSALQTFNDYVAIFRTNDFIEYARLNFDTLQTMPLLTLFLFISIPSALIGSIMARITLQEIFSNIMIATLMVIFLIGGLLIKMVEVLSLGTMSGTIIGEFIGGPILAIGLFLLFYNLAEFIPLNIEKSISALGKRAILSYFIYALVMMIIFYGIGFNLYGEITVILAIGIGLMVALALGILTKFLTKY